MPQRTALIAGSTGLTGSLCLKQLLADPAYAQVVAITRRPIPESHPKLIQKIVDFDHLSQLAPIPADDAFCALGTTIKKAGSQEAFRKIDAGYAKSFAEFSLAGGAREFALVSSVGANPSSRYFYLRTKGELEDAISALPFTSVHIFRPSFLMGTRPDRRPGEEIATAFLKVLQYAFVGPLSQYRPILASTVAAAMIAAARKPEPRRHIYFFNDIHTLVTNRS